MREFEYLKSFISLQSLHDLRSHFIKVILLYLSIFSGYQMLRCKLRCTKANGRTTDNSHYHCCLCGRVLVRKVHLYCHLQAHAVGSMQEIDEMLDAKDDTEEGPLGDAEMDDDDNDTSLDTSQITGLESAEQDNMVALSDGTQVTVSNKTKKRSVTFFPHQ